MTGLFPSPEGPRAPLQTSFKACEMATPVTCDIGLPVAPGRPLS